MSIVQDGMGCPFFAPCVYGYCCGQALTDVTPDVMDIPDPGACSVAKKVQLLLLFPVEMCQWYVLVPFLQIASAEGPEFDDARVVTDSWVIQKLMDAGYTKALLYTHKQDMLSTLASHYCLLNVKAELDQFCEGLETLGLLAEIKNHPQVFRCLFVSGENALTAGTVIC